MSDLKTFINSKLPEIEEMKKTATERVRIVNDFMDQVAGWLTDYKRDGLLDFEVKEDKYSFDLIGKSVIVTALSKGLCIWQILNPKVFIVRIENTDISYVDGNWIYKEPPHESIVNKETFEAILIKELSDACYSY